MISILKGAFGLLGRAFTGIASLATSAFAAVSALFSASSNALALAAVGLTALLTVYD